MSKKIMIFEDDISLAELIRYYLEEEGYQTKIFLSGDNFFKKVIRYRPHVITLDFFLNSVIGLKMYNALKKNRSTHDIPIVIVSGVDLPPLKLEALKPEGYITKPFEENEIKTVIKNILTR